MGNEKETANKEKEVSNALIAEVKKFSKEEKAQLEKSLGMTIPKNITDQVLNSLDNAMQDGKLHLPKNYSMANALKSAWLELQSVVDKNKQPALKVTTGASQAEAMLNMVLNGLNPAKNQVYFIVYGNRLSAFVSVYGKMAIAKRIPGVEGEPVATLIYEGDNPKMSHNEFGEEVIVEHEISWENKNKKIVGAYATLKMNGVTRSAVMNMAEIKESWKGIPGGGGKDHSNSFPGEFAKRTVMNRLLKPIIQSSDDAYLIMSDGGFDKEDVIDVDDETGEIPMTEKEKSAAKQLHESTIQDGEFEDTESEPSEPKESKEPEQKETTYPGPYDEDEEAKPSKETVTEGAKGQRKMNF